MNGRVVLDLDPASVPRPGPRVEQSARYWAAYVKEFPLAMPAVWGGCVGGEEARAEVLYCPACRTAEERWARRHPAAARLAPGLAGGDRRLLEFVE